MKWPIEVRFAMLHTAPVLGCWVWQGAIQSRGYGSFGAATGKAVLAHRWSYEAARGKIPKGLTLDHLCRNKRCVRVDHLEVVSGRENTRRHFATVTNCKWGHPLSGENLHIRKDGKRRCVACYRAAQEAARARRLSEHRNQEVA